MFQNAPPAELKALIDTLGMPVYVLDVTPESFRYAAINQPMEALTGVTHAALTGQPLGTLLPAELANRMSHRYRHCIDARQALECEETVDLAGVHHDWRITLVPVMADNGIATRLLATIADVSDQRRAERSQRYQTALLKAQQESSPEGMLAVDRQRRIRSWNRRFLRLWNLPEAAVHAEDDREVLQHIAAQTRNPNQFLAQVERLYANPSEAVEGIELELLDGRVMEGHSVALIGEEILGRVWFTRDVTAQRRTEARLWRQRGELAHTERLRMAGEMAAGLAHELNQPLAAIVTYSESCLYRLETGTPEPERTVDILRKIAEQGLRAGEIIRRLRAFVRRTEPRREFVDLNALIREVVALIRIEARAKDTRLRLQLDDSLPPVWVDAIQIQQVLMNLLKNAVEAVENQERERWITTYTLHAGPDTVAVGVSDTGPGLPDNVRDNLFQPFYTTKSQGTGLGLWLSQSIVEGHGGRLGVAATDASGTTLEFTLPVVEPDAQGQLPLALDRRWPAANPFVPPES